MHNEARSVKSNQDGDALEFDKRKRDNNSQKCSSLHQNRTKFSINILLYGMLRLKHQDVFYGS
jgi:hypothetical protein